MKDFPTKGVEMSILLVVSDLEISRDFYKDILGAELFREYGGTTSVFKFQGTWIILTTEGEPTKDKPGVNFKSLKDKENINFEFTMRVSDCMNSYEILKERGANFLTPPVKNGRETRAFFRDPDGYLFEISEYK